MISSTDMLIRDCLEGKEGAWEMLINTYSKRIFNMSYQFAGTYEEAEDHTQEIFAKLYNSLPKFDFEKNFTAWLLTLAKNHLIDQYRKTKWEKRTRDDFHENLMPPENSDDPEKNVERKETKQVIWDSLNKLSSDIRMAVILRDIQGKKYEEIAEVMELPLGTVKSRVNRGRLQLAKILKIEKERENEL